jgi:hypothetical protein
MAGQTRAKGSIPTKVKSVKTSTKGRKGGTTNARANGGVNPTRSKGGWVKQ